jgi:hypothetical protein
MGNFCNFADRLSALGVHRRCRPLLFKTTTLTEGALVFFIGILASLASLKAEQVPSSIVDGVERSDELSPLFLERSSLRRTRLLDEQLNMSWSDISTLPPAIQPRLDSLHRTFWTVIRSVDGVFHRAVTVAEGKIPILSVTLEPAEFELQERREITVTLALRNESNRQLQILFPTSQRIEILTKDQMGRLIERWSEGRVFDPLEEIVIINPNEMVEYSQRIPTREMKKGETYMIEVFLFNNPQYTKTVAIYPK